MKKIINQVCSVGMAAMMLVACTNKLDEINVDPNSPTETDPGFLFVSGTKKAMDNIWDQWNNGRGGMHYAQYWSSATYTNESRYQIREGVNNTYWNVMYAGTIRDMEEIIRINTEEVFDYSQNQIAIANIIKVWTYHFLVDTYEDVPYTEAMGGTERPTAKYDKAEDIYVDLLRVLKEQEAKLQLDHPSFAGSMDPIYEGNVANWKAFANSLRLRIAMRIIDVAALEDQAKQAIQEAVEAGVFTSNNQNAYFNYLNAAPNNNPINEAFKTRSDFTVCKTLMDYMKSVDDPRIPMYANPASATGEYVGEPYGLNQGHAEQIPSSEVSFPSDLVRSANFPGVFMDYAEVEFLLAEAAARGVITGSAEAHYNAGIEASLNRWGITDADAIAAYKRKVPFSGGDWKNVIGTQKWIAMYMQGLQAWFERLRLDFKKPDGTDLFVDPIDGSLDPNVTDVPTRMTYPIDEQQLNSDNYRTAVSEIGGDTKAVKHFWDIN